MSTLPVTTDPLGVVVVDDTPDLRALLRMALERRGEFQVVAEAGDGQEGVRLVQELQPDVVLLDIAMPVMDGLEALPLIRAACPRATVVMLSGFGAAEMTQRAMLAGADGYLQKGLPIRALLSQVRSIAEQTADRRNGGLRPQPGEAPAEVAHEEREFTEVSDRLAVVDHLELAPVGFLQVRDGQVIRGNREAGRLLGDVSAADPPLLDALAPELAEHLATHPEPDSTTMVDLGQPPRSMRVTVRRSGLDHVLYLQPETSDEAELLRRSMATAAHEIRNPVSVLSAAAESLLEEELTADRDRILALIVRQARLLDAITADLLTAGQAHRGILTVQLQPLAAGALVRAMTADLDDVTVLDETTTGVLTDPHRFAQMVGNLLGNARKYGAAPYVVKLRTEGPEVVVDVEDDGAGVPEEFRPRLFQEYSRAADTTASGTGLGLFVVRSLAEAQGGTVGYRPRDPHGSVFTLRLPAAPA